MNAMRVILFCALVGWMAADAQCNWGPTAPRIQFPWGSMLRRGSYVPAAVSRTSYVAAADGSGPTLNPAPPAAFRNRPRKARRYRRMLKRARHDGRSHRPLVTCRPRAAACKEAGNCDTCGERLRLRRLLLAVVCLVRRPLHARSEPNTVYTSAEPPANPVNQGYFNDFNWTWGGQATVGYRFGCCCDWAVEGTYWGLAECNSDGGPGIPGPYVSPMTFGLTSILGTTGGGRHPNGDQTANNYTDDSPDHHIWRNYEAQDVEINLVRTLCGGECNRFDVDFLAGVRWFRFQDGLVFGAEQADDGTTYADDWLYLNDHITNDLVGGQVGFNASYRFADCWKVFVTPKFGVYDNHMTLDYNLYAVSCTTGQQYQGSSQTYTNPNYPVHATSRTASPS